MVLLYFLFLLPFALGNRVLNASSLVPCMANSQLTAKTFQVSFNPDTKSLSYNLDLNTTINGYVTANVAVYAYGFAVINETVDLCKLPFKQFCPLYSGEVIVNSVETILTKFVDMIPGIAYTVPDIDAYVKVQVYDSNKTNLACMVASFTNGKTVSHTGAKWATAIVAGLGLLVLAMLLTFGNSNAALHISVNALSLFTYFQSVVLVAMEHVTSVPPIASAWAENLAWSMGLIRVGFMQKIFRWYVQSTGGTPTLYFQTAGLEKAILVQKRIVQYLEKRAPGLLVNSSPLLRVLRGIKRIGFNQGIEVTLIVVTGFTFFVLCGYALCLFILLAKGFFELLVATRAVKNPGFAFYFRKNYLHILKGALLRYISIGFTQLTVFSLWEFTENDSPALIVLAVLFLILVVGILGWATYRAWYFGKTSVETYKNPAALLYGNQDILDKYGFAYTMYNANMYWWGVVFICYNFLKAIFIGLCQASGQVQSLVIWISDMAYLVGLVCYKPYLDKLTNILNIIILTVTVLNSFMFVFFSNLFRQPAAVSSIMGWVFFILNAAFSLILLIVVVVYIAMALLSKVPDSRFRRAGDDRTSFQRNLTLLMDEKSLNDSLGAKRASALLATPNPGAEELLDLGRAAKTHQNNWEDEIYKLKDMVNSRGELTDSNLTEEALQLKSKSTIERLRGEPHNDNDKIGLEDDEPIQIVKPSFGTRMANSMFGRSDQRSAGLNSLTRKLSAMKLSRSNSQALKRNGLLEKKGPYSSIPMDSAPNSPNLNAPRAATHGRTLSATPITSPGAEEQFHFTSNNPYGDAQPTRTVDVTQGGALRPNQGFNHSPSDLTQSPNISDADDSGTGLMGGRYNSDLGRY